MAGAREGELPKPLFAFEGTSIMYRVDADGARRVRPWAGKNKEAGYRF